jgi:hypothetical protein
MYVCMLRSYQHLGVVVVALVTKNALNTVHNTTAAGNGA